MEIKDKIKKTTYQDEVVVTNYLNTCYSSFYVERLRSDFNFVHTIKEEIKDEFKMNIYELPLKDVYDMGYIVRERDKRIIKSILSLINKLSKLKNIDLIEIRKDRKLWLKASRSCLILVDEKVELEKLIAGTILHHFNSWEKTSVGEVAGKVSDFYFYQQKAGSKRKI
ncbi:MAG: hypothetical protein ACR2IQ_02910 [Minisyncoccia bacterium]